MDSSNTIEVTNLSKKYRLGTIGMSSLREDLSRWWSRKKQNDSTKGNTNTAGIDQSIRINDSEFWALHDLNFKIPKGEVVGLIGTNGSGKSTLLKILSRITEPSSGKGQVRGKVASLLEVGTGFHPELTGRENIYINGAILGMGRKEVDYKFDEIVHFSGISDFIDTPIKRYSSGMTVRLGFAVAAHLDPDILIVDEVLAVGDASFQKQCIGKMESISSSGKTVIFVSHNMASIESLCTCCILLEEGNIKSYSKPGTVIAEYLSGLQVKRSENLLMRSDRRGSGEMILESIKYFDDQSKLSNVLRTGNRGEIHVRFQKNKNPIGRLTFCLSISNDRGQRISSICSNFVDCKLPHQECLTIKIIIPKISLRPGDYHLTSYLELNGSPCDWVVNATEMSIVSGDYYGTGVLLNESQGEVHLDFFMTSN